MSPFITFTSDFGQKDFYVACVKAVILSRIPQAVLLDVTHDIVPFFPLLALPPLLEIMEVSPPSSIHLVVVDPGVGSHRRALAGISKGQKFVFPDNGLPYALSRWIKDLHLFHLSDPRIFGGKESPTFQGRDLFAKAVVALSLEKNPADLGPEISHDQLARETAAENQIPGNLLVWNIDRFGNILLGYRVSTPPDSVLIETNGQLIPYVYRYQDVPKGHLGALINSSGWLEIFCREGNASDMTGLRAGMFTKVTTRGGQGQTLT